MTNYREILRLSSKGLSRTSIGEAIGCSRNTVSDVLRRAEEQNIRWPLPDNMSDNALEATLFPIIAQRNTRKKPDYEKVHKELGKPGVTFTLLWDEYCDECRQSGEIPYAFTQFKYHYYEYAQAEKATMHLNHKPGEEIETDWAGQTMNVTNTDTGEALTAYVFVGTLPCSGYSYVEAFLSQDEENWITAHVHMFRYFGGCSRILVPDNLKTGCNDAQSSDIFELIEARYRSASTIFITQFDKAGWYSKLGESVVSDAILDRIVHSSYTVKIEGDISMRERYGLKN